MQIAIFGFYMILIGLAGLILAAALLAIDEDRARVYGSVFLKVLIAGVIIWLYGNAVFIIN